MCSKKCNTSLWNVVNNKYKTAENENKVQVPQNSIVLVNVRCYFPPSVKHTNMLMQFENLLMETIALIWPGFSVECWCDVLQWSDWTLELIQSQRLLTVTVVFISASCFSSATELQRVGATAASVPLCGQTGGGGGCCLLPPLCTVTSSERERGGEEREVKR